ncbi:hypothetical protein [Streptomyces pseudogriseolus]|uniref:hypothetical protein n=1 Tax=Streptomyces pseudogriseolus TaxID=36817 RepID=UPI003FA305AC
MSDLTGSTPEQDTPRAYGWCAWHGNFAAGVRLIEVIEQGSGPGGARFACAPCRKVFGLVPFADQ